MKKIADQIKKLAKNSHKDVLQWIKDAVCEVTAIEKINTKSVRGKKNG